MADEETKEKLDIESEASADSTSPEELYLDLIKTIRKYHSSDDMTMIQKACKIADETHKEQRRRSGESYIIYPLCAATILADLEMGKETITAGLLHDVVEDMTMTLDQLTREFGLEVPFLVDGVTKLTQLNRNKDKAEIQVDSLRRMFLAMAKDIRAIITKLVDRLHDMCTGQYWKPEKQKGKARETMEIYTPIADRLGISKVKIELDNLLLKFLKPEVYYDLVEKVDLCKDARETLVQEIVNEVKNHMKEAGVETMVGGRVKRFFSIYKKMVNQNKTLDQIYDLFVVRIMVETVKDCYAALGVIHEMYKPIPDRFKDYIAMPKQNTYQSLHTTLVGGNGQLFEIQIRTCEMYRTMEYGIAAHWKYKGSGSGQIQAGSEEAKLNWLRRILEWQRDTDDPKEFLNMVKGDLDLSSSSVYRFTPSGDVKILPSGPTPIDSAYCIHSTVGNKTVETRVSGKPVPIEYAIQNGDQSETITSQNSKGPNRDWLNIVESTQAKNKINQQFKNQMKEDNIVRGRDAIERYCRTKGINWSDISKPEFVEKAMNRYAFRDWESVLASVGYGGMKGGQVINKVMEGREKEIKREIMDEDVPKGIADTAGESGEATVRKSKSGIVVKGIHDLVVRSSKCCNPVLGDEAVGFVTRGRGVSIHCTDCINIINLPEDERSWLVDAEWQVTEGATCNEQCFTEIKISVNNRIGMFTDISKVFTEKQIDTTSMNVRTSKQGKATIIIAFDIHGTGELDRLIDKIRQIEGVLDIERTAGQSVDEHSPGPGGRCQFAEAGGSQAD